MDYENAWEYNGEPLTSEFLEKHKFYGMVYELENTANSRKYIGKKFFWFKKTKQIKGKRKRFLVESDWKAYYGSNAELLVDIQQIGENRIKRRVLHMCKNKSECAYLELYEQVVNKALLSEEYYNAWIAVKVRGDNIKDLHLIH